jgi:WD40 repeat protein
MLFPGASVGVVLDTKSMIQRHLIGHNDMISCLTLHPTEPMVATGQSDSKVLGKSYITIWNYETCQEVARIRYHLKGVQIVRFSADGNKLYTVGHNQRTLLAVFDWRTVHLQDLPSPEAEHIPEWTELMGKEPVIDLVFNEFMDDPNLSEFATIGKVFRLWLLDGSTVQTSLPSSWEHTQLVQKTFYTAAWMSREVVLVACHTGDVYVFDRGELIKFFKVHDLACTAIKVTDVGIFTAGSDQHVRLFAKSEIVKKDGAVVRTEVSFLKDLDFTGLRSVPFRITHAMDYKPGRLILGFKDNEVIEINVDDSNADLNAGE